MAGSFGSRAFARKPGPHQKQLLLVRTDPLTSGSEQTLFVCLLAHLVCVIFRLLFVMRYQCLFKVPSRPKFRAARVSCHTVSAWPGTLLAGQIIQAQ